MPELRELQQEFGVALLDIERAPPGDVTSHSARHPVRRFNVYRNNVVGSLVDVLEAYFPVATRLLGEEFFRATARAYVVSDPPRSPILSRYGAGFAEFLQSFGPVQDLPYLPDVVSLEWLRQRAYHAADAAPQPAADLACVPVERIAGMTFMPHPSLGLIASTYPVVSIWRTNTHDEIVTPISPDAGGELALIVRPRLEVLVVPINAGTYALATALVAGETLIAAAARASAAQAKFNLQAELATLIDAGAFAGYRLSNPDQTQEAVTWPI